MNELNESNVILRYKIINKVLADEVNFQTRYDGFGLIKLCMNAGKNKEAHWTIKGSHKLTERQQKWQVSGQCAGGRGGSG